MHWLIRPDSVHALEDEGVKKALGRYVEVSKNKKLAKFIITKTIPIDVDLSSSDEELWKAHETIIKDFKKLEKEHDNKDIKQLKFPTKSLLDLKIELAKRILNKCRFCERKCGVNRFEKKRGFCNLDIQSRLSSEFLHMGEEACLVPSHTLFFIGCSFYCVFCQNWTISRHVEKGLPVTGSDLAKMVKKRRLMEGSRNVNLVGGSPTPNTHIILEMLRELDVNIPVVWNSNMYMTMDTMKLLNGCVDVYLADFKYGNNNCAERLSKIKNYWEVTTRNHLVAKKQAELLIRHLVLPNHIECCTKPIIEWIAKNFDNKVRVNIMAQYRPEFEAFKIPDINRRVMAEEMERAFNIARDNGLTNLD